jgi:hypothetical protein
MLAGSQRCKVGLVIQAKPCGSPVSNPVMWDPPFPLASTAGDIFLACACPKPRAPTRILRSGLSHTDRGCRHLPGDTSSTVRTLSRARLHTAAEVVMMGQLAIGWVLTGETGAWPIVSRGTNAGNHYVTVVHVGTGRCRTGSIRAWDLK